VQGSDPLRAAYYRETLRDWMARLKRPGGRAPATSGSGAGLIDPETCRQLAALGYVDMRCR
jgi:hypothetical protein